MRYNSLIRSKKGSIKLKDNHDLLGILFNEPEAMQKLREQFEEYGIRSRNTSFSAWNTFSIFLNQVLSRDHSCQDAIAQVNAK